MNSPPFHLALPVTDIRATREFYVNLLGCAVGRESERWIDFDFQGHQLSAHLVETTLPEAPTNAVDGDRVPARHFGLVLEWDRWHAIARRLGDHGVNFLIAPRIRFEAEIGEQATMFFRDPSGNALEFKSFKDPAQLFAH